MTTNTGEPSELKPFESQLLLRLAWWILLRAMMLEEVIKHLASLGWVPAVFTMSALAPLQAIALAQLNAKYRAMKVIAALDSSVRWQVDPDTKANLAEPSGAAAARTLRVALLGLQDALHATMRVAQVVVPGSDAGDLLAVLSTEQPAPDRQAAAERLVNRLGHVIYPKRWDLVLPELRRLAESHQRDLKRELGWLIESRLFEAVRILELGEALGEATIEDMTAVFQGLRTGLDRLLMNDLAPRWWREPKRAELREGKEEYQRDAKSKIAALEAKLSVDLVIARAGLGPAEAELVAAARALGSLEAAAEVSALLTH